MAWRMFFFIYLIFHAFNDMINRIEKDFSSTEN